MITTQRDRLAVDDALSPQQSAGRALPFREQPHPGPDDRGVSDAGESWLQVWSHRDALLRVARRRSDSHADAEDAVAEAMVRSHETADLDMQRLGGWLTSVTMRLCIDDARDRAREPKRVAYQGRLGMTAEDHGPAVCDRAEASWLASHLAELPARQRQALELRADGADVGSIATSMGVSYKVAECLLQRARAHMRAVLSTAAAWIGLVLGALVAVVRRRTGAAATVTLAAASAAILSGGLLEQPAPLAEPATTTEQLFQPAATPAEAPGGPAITPAEVPAPLAADPVPAPVAEAASTTPAGPQPPPAVDLPKVPVPTREPTSASVAGVEVRDGGSSHHKPEQGFLQSTRECLESGLEVSLTLVGCDPE